MRESSLTTPTSLAPSTAAQTIEQHIRCDAEPSQIEHFGFCLCCPPPLFSFSEFSWCWYQTTTVLKSFQMFGFHSYQMINTVELLNVSSSLVIILL